MSDVISEEVFGPFWLMLPGLRSEHFANVHSHGKIIKLFHSYPFSLNRKDLHHSKNIK